MLIWYWLIIPLFLIVFLFYIPISLKKLFHLSEDKKDVLCFCLAIPILLYYMFWTWMGFGVAVEGEDLIWLFLMVDCFLFMGLAPALSLSKKFHWAFYLLAVYQAVIFACDIGVLPYPDYFDWLSNFRDGRSDHDFLLKEAYQLYFYHLSLIGITLICSFLIRKNAKYWFRVLFLVLYRPVVVYALNFI